MHYINDVKDKKFSTQVTVTAIFDSLLAAYYRNKLKKIHFLFHSLSSPLK